MGRKVGDRVYHVNDYYLLLWITPSASESEIKRAYKQLALKYHSDKNGGNRHMFHLLEEAKRVLLDPELRKEFDSTRDTSRDPSLFTFFGKNSKGKYESNGTPALKCGFRLSDEFLEDLEKSKAKYRHATLEDLQDNYAAAFDTKNLVPPDNEDVDSYLCDLCNKAFSSEYDHFESVLAEYVDWILGEDEVEAEDIFETLGQKLVNPDELEKPLMPADFCWTKDFFDIQLETLTELVIEAEFQKADILSWGILLEIQKVYKQNIFDENATFGLLYQLVTNRWANDKWKLVEAYKILLRNSSELGDTPNKHFLIHKCNLEMLLERKSDERRFFKAVGALHFVLSTGPTLDEESFENQLKAFGDASADTVSSILIDSIETLDYLQLSSLITAALPVNLKPIKDFMRKMLEYYKLSDISDCRRLQFDAKSILYFLQAGITYIDKSFEQTQWYLDRVLLTAASSPEDTRESLCSAVADMYANYELHSNIIRLTRKNLTNLQTEDESELFPKTLQVSEHPLVQMWPFQTTFYISYRVAKLNEEAFVKQYSSTDHLKLACAYLDLYQGVSTMSERLVCYTHVISQLLEYMKNATKKSRPLYEILALKDQIEEKCNLLYRLLNCYSSPETSIYGKRLLVSSLRAMGLQIQKVMRQKVCGYNVPQFPIYSPDSVKLLQNCFKQTLDLVRVFPCTTIPFLSVQEYSLASHSLRLCLQQYLARKTSEVPIESRARPQLYSHAILDGLWREWGDEEHFGDFYSARTMAMMDFLSYENWTWKNVEDNVMYPIIRRTEKGWMDNECTSLDFSHEEDNMIFESFLGFEFNTETGEVVYLLKPASGNEYETKALFTMSDIEELMEKGISYSFFTLEDPDPNFRIHPFQGFKYLPPNLKDTGLLYTCKEADVLLKQFITGMEINGYGPLFKIRPAKEGFLQRLNPELQALLRPVMERTKDPINPFSENAHRFWFQMDEIKFNSEKLTDGWERLTFPEEVNISVRTKMLIRNTDGVLIDDDSENEYSNTAEQQLARKFTQNYNEIGKQFPILLRLRELSKILAMVKVLTNLAENFQNKTKILPNWSGNAESSDALKQLSSHLNGIRETILEFRDRIITDGYPKNTETNVEERFRNLIRENLGMALVPNLRQIIRDCLQSKDNDEVENCLKQLNIVFKLPMTPEWRGKIHHFLLKDVSAETQIIHKCGEPCQQTELAKANNILQKLKEIGLGLDRNTDDIKFGDLQSDPNVCHWVPATFCSSFDPPVQYSFELEPEETPDSTDLDENEMAETNLLCLQQSSGIENQVALGNSQDTTGASKMTETKSEQTERRRKIDTGYKPSRVYGGVSLNPLLKPLNNGKTSVPPDAKRCPPKSGGRAGSSSGGGGNGKEPPEKPKKKGSKAGRTKVLRDTMMDPKTPSWLRGLLKQEFNRVERLKKRGIRAEVRLNFTKDGHKSRLEMAHCRGFEAAKGFDYSWTYVQQKGLHDLQHQFDKGGKLNKTPADGIPREGQWTGK